jgi:hypothetical protein
MRSLPLVMSDSRVVIGLQATEDTGAADTNDAVGFLWPGRRRRILFLDVWVGDVVLGKSSDTHGLRHSRLQRPRDEPRGIFDHLQMQSDIP